MSGPGRGSGKAGHPVTMQGMITVRLPPAVLLKIDERRTQGLFPRSRSQWVRDAIQAELAKPYTGS